MNPFELNKERVLIFTAEPESQITQAYILLSGLKDFQVEKGHIPNSLKIKYNVAHYSLEGLEKALQKEGFKFKYSLLRNLKRHLVHYCEDVQYHNLKTPEPRTKNNTQEVFVKAYEQHPHGDHDETKPLSRQPN